MYALVEIKGKQYKVIPGQTLKVDRLSGVEKDQAITLDSVLMVSDGKQHRVGTPHLADVKIKATVGESVKDKKVLIFKRKRRKGYHRTQGHRQQYDTLKIEEILGA